MDLITLVGLATVSFLLFVGCIGAAQWIDRSVTENKEVSDDDR